MPVTLALMNNWALRSHYVHPNLERLAKARPAETEKITAAGRAADKIVGSKKSGDADDAASSPGSGC